jgi:hypothetical protein
MTTPVFHRLTVPTYFGALPSNYDYINNAVTGTPALADGQRADGINAGTYFVAFTDDGTSKNVNRPAMALAQNTDFIDNILHADLAIEWPSATMTAGAGGDTGATIPYALTGPIFMGQDQDQNFGFIILTTGGDQINVAGTQVVVHTATDLGTPPTAAGSGGFSTGDVQLTYNATIPEGVQYRIIFGRRTCLASLPADALLRGPERLYKTVFNAQELLRQLHGNSEAWSDPWDSTIFDLTTRGLNGLYNLSTTGDGGTENTPGAGAVAVRTAQAMTMKSEIADRHMPDAFNAAWRADLTDDAAINTNGNYGAIGSIGFMAYTKRWSVSGETPHAPAVAAFANIINRAQPVGSAPSAGQGYWTRITGSATGTIASGSFTGLYYLTLDSVSNTYFWQADTNGTKRTAVGLGRDLLRLTLASGNVIVVRMVELSASNAKVVYFTMLDGGPSDDLDTLPVTVTNVEWVTPTMVHGNGAMASKQYFLTDPLPGNLPIYNDDGLFLVIPPPATDTNSASSAGYGQYNGPPAGVSMNYFGRDTNLVDGNRILGWGSFNQSSISGSGGLWEELAFLTSDGGVHYGYSQQVYAGYNTNSTDSDLGVTGNNARFTSPGTVTWTLDLDHFDTFYLDLASGAYTLNIGYVSNQTADSISPSGYPLQPGRKIKVIIQQNSAGCAFGATNFLASAAGKTVNYGDPWGTNVPPLTGAANAIDIYEIEILPFQTPIGMVTRFGDTSANDYVPDRGAWRALTAIDWPTTGQYPGQGSNMQGSFSACWDPFGYRWVVGGWQLSSVLHQPSISTDGGKTWSSYGSGTLSDLMLSIAVCVNPLNGEMIQILGPVSTAFGGYAYCPFNGTWSYTIVSGSAEPNFVLAAAAWFYTSPSAGEFIVLGVAGSAGVGGAITSGGGVKSTTGTSWTNIAGALPAAWTGLSGPNSPFNVYSAVATPPGQASTAAIFGTTVWNNGTGTYTSVIVSTTDGATFSAVTNPFGANNGHFLNGLAVDNTNPLQPVFLALVGLSGSGDGNTSVYKSTDNGATWTSIKTFNGSLFGQSNFTGAGIAVLGQLWVCALSEGNRGPTVLWSLDQGATWHYGNNRLPANPSPGNGLYQTLIAGDTQFLGINGQYYAVSLPSGISPIQV